jgi:hypothetical protein
MFSFFNASNFVNTNEFSSLTNLLKKIETKKNELRACLKKKIENVAGQENNSKIENNSDTQETTETSLEEKKYNFLSSLTREFDAAIDDFNKLPKNEISLYEKLGLINKLHSTLNTKLTSESNLQLLLTSRNSNKETGKAVLQTGLVLGGIVLPIVTLPSLFISIPLSLLIAGLTKPTLSDCIEKNIPTTPETAQTLFDLLSNLTIIRKDLNKQIVEKQQAYADLPNYYEALELEFGASLDQVKANYYKLARQYHPDKLSTQNLSLEQKQQGTEKFIKALDAYEFLSDTNPNFKEGYDKNYPMNKRCRM